ncbi:MAG: hypothetical protein U0841_17900 [Chloroflexia bacterium]
MSLVAVGVGRAGIYAGRFLRRYDHREVAMISPPVPLPLLIAIIVFAGLYQLLAPVVRRSGIAGASGDGGRLSVLSFAQARRCWK